MIQDVLGWFRMIQDQDTSQWARVDYQCAAAGPNNVLLAGRGRLQNTIEG